jgi:putative ABC transport system permease protein
MKLTLCLLGLPYRPSYLCFGIPIAYLLMEKFLQNYAYHTELSWPIFAGTAVLVALLSILIVIFQVAKASLANPVQALRNE